MEIKFREVNEVAKGGRKAHQSIMTDPKSLQTHTVTYILRELGQRYSQLITRIFPGV
jgi:hypothetical protein